jgi:hypothetical protein
MMAWEVVHNIWIAGKDTAHLRGISGWMASFEGSGKKKKSSRLNTRKKIFYIFFSFIIDLPFLIIRK